MISKFISAVKWLLGVLLAVAAIFVAGRKAGKQLADLEASENAREVEQEAIDAMQHGMGDEQRIRQELENSPVADIDLD